MRFRTHSVDLYSPGARDTSGLSKSDTLVEAGIKCRVEQAKPHSYDAAGQRDVNERNIRVFFEPKTGRTISPESILVFETRRYKVEQVFPQYTLSRLDHFEARAVETDDGL